MFEIRNGIKSLIIFCDVGLFCLIRILYLFLYPRRDARTCISKTVKTKNDKNQKREKTKNGKKTKNGETQKR